MTVDYLQLASGQECPKWTHTPEQVKSNAKDLAERYVQLNDSIAKIENPTIDNVLIPYADFSNDNAFIENQLTFYQSVSADKDLRDASTEAEQLLDECYIQQGLRVEVYQVFKKLWESVKDADESVIDSESKRYLDKIITGYKRSGLDLPEAKREQVKKLKIDLSNLQTQFAKNLNEENGFIAFTAEELDGVDKDTIEQFETVEEDGVKKYKMTYKYPDILPVLKHAKNQNTRKQAYVGNQNKSPENAEILEKIIKVRFELAKLLGYSTYSDFVLEDRLAKNKENVLSFLADLQNKLTPLGQKELERLLEFKNKDLVERGLEKQDKYYAWDSAYYNELLLEKEYKVDHQKLAEYFPMDSTVSKMLGFYEQIFDVKFVKIEKPNRDLVWHEDVQQFAVFQNITRGDKNREFMGWIYFDMHPRKGKYGHAANFGLGPGFENKDGSRHTPVTALVCNFTKPTPEKPSLLKHDEVTTFFHELGHGVHNILSQTKYSRFHGTHVERDFVETPSQMLEYWTWSKDEIRNLSSHFKTKEQLSDDLIDQLIKTKNVNNGLFNLRQLHFGLFDMKLHTIEKEEELEQLDLTKLWNEMRQTITLIDGDNIPTKGYASFGHIAGGYESGYYGYLYSNVYAADIYYTLFKKEPMNIDNGIRYRDIILKRGGSREIMDNLVELLGRKPTTDAFLQEILG